MKPVSSLMAFDHHRQPPPPPLTAAEWKWKCPTTPHPTIDSPKERWFDYGFSSPPYYSIGIYNIGGKVRKKVAYWFSYKRGKEFPYQLRSLPEGLIEIPWEVNNPSSVLQDKLFWELLTNTMLNQSLQNSDSSYLPDLPQLSSLTMWLPFFLNCDARR